MLDWLHSEITAATSTAQAGAVLVYVIAVVATFALTRAIAKTIGVLLFGGLVLGAVYNTSLLQDKGDKELKRSMPAHVRVVQVPSAPGQLTGGASPPRGV